MKILLLTQYFPPESGSCSVHMGELAEYLASKGHQVTVLTGFPNYPQGKIYNSYKRRFISKEKTDKDYEIIRTFLTVTPHRRSFGPRLKNYLSFMVTSLFGGLVSGRHDLIYYYSPPLFLSVTAGFLGLYWRVPIVMELNDLWPRAPIAMGILKGKKKIFLAQTLEKFAYKTATKIFVYSERMKKEVSKVYPSKDKIEVHPLWIDSALFFPPSPEGVDKIRRKYNFGERFIVMYTGLVGMAQGLGTLVQAAEVLSEEKNYDILLVIVGGGPKRDDLIKISQEKRLNNIIFIPHQPIEEMANFMAAADVLLSHLQSAPHRKGTIPAKILSYMAAQRPVLICADEGAATELVKESRCGLTCPPEDPKELAKKLLELKKMGKKKLIEMGKRGRRVVQERFEKISQLKKLENRLTALI